MLKLNGAPLSFILRPVAAGLRFRGRVRLLARARRICGHFLGRDRDGDWSHHFGRRIRTPGFGDLRNRLSAAFRVGADRPESRPLLDDSNGGFSPSGGKRSYSSFDLSRRPTPDLQDPGVGSDLSDAVHFDMGYVAANGPTSRSSTAVLCDFLSEHKIADAKALSTILIERFGSLAELLAADAHSVRHAGAGANVVQKLLTLRITHQFLLSEAISKRNLLLSEPVLERYFRATIGLSNVEQFHVLYVDARNHLIAGRTHWSGTVDSVTCHIRDVVYAAIGCGARALILAHNHPSGSLEPSEQDVRLTRDFLEATKRLELSILDHWIITREGFFSFRRSGLL